VPERHDDSRRKEAERYREMLLWQIVDNLDSERSSVADRWSPPMTAAGRHIMIAREIEARLRALWATFSPSAPPPFRAPYPDENLADHALSEAVARSDAKYNRRNRLKFSLKQIVESEDAFALFPVEAHDELRRLRNLLAQVVEESLA
jgi:hypothetical protein